MLAINVTLIPSIWHLVDNEWQCQHPSTHNDVIERYDDYKDAVTGVPQPLWYEPIRQCDTCPAWYRPLTEEWYDEL